MTPATRTFIKNAAFYVYAGGLASVIHSGYEANSTPLLRWVPDIPWAITAVCAAVVALAVVGLVLAAVRLGVAVFAGLMVVIYDRAREPGAAENGHPVLEGVQRACIYMVWVGSSLLGAYLVGLVFPDGVLEKFWLSHAGVILGLRWVAMWESGLLKALVGEQTMVSFVQERHSKREN